eukprot:519309-Rhodomonas_salina.1
MLSARLITFSDNLERELDGSTDGYVGLRAKLRAAVSNADQAAFLDFEDHLDRFLCNDQVRRCVLAPKQAIGVLVSIICPFAYPSFTSAAQAFPRLAGSVARLIVWWLEALPRSDEGGFAEKARNKLENLLLLGISYDGDEACPSYHQGEEGAVQPKQRGKAFTEPSLRALIFPLQLPSSGRGYDALLALLDFGMKSQLLASETDRGK